MTLSTAFTRAFGIRHPVALAPMDRVAGARLAAAVSAAGGLGLLGGGLGNREWLAAQLPALAGANSRPWGVGLVVWAVDRAVLEQALAHRPDVVMLSFGDPAPLAPAVRAAGARLIVQATDLDEVRRALDAGADAVVAQGGDAGGHGGHRGTLAFLPAAVDLAGDTPVLGAGGITDGRGLAATLALGAAGVLLGTRFALTEEADLPDRDRRAALAAGGEDTQRSRLVDIARGSAWPARYSGRSLRSPLLAPWAGREEQLAGDAEALRRYRDALKRGDPDARPVWAGEGLDLVTDAPAASTVLTRIVLDAQRALAAAAGSVDPSSQGGHHQP